MDLSPLQIVAIAKAVKDKAYKEASAKLDAIKDAPVDFLVRIKGTVSKGESSERTQSNKIKWTLLFAILASKVNKETLAAVIREYLEAVAKKSFENQEAQIKDHVQSTVDELKGLNKAMVAGSVKSKVAIDLVDATTSVTVDGLQVKDASVKVG
jgi:hypothetical protein